MTGIFNYTAIILLLPLFVFAFTGLFGSRFKPGFSGILGTTGLGIITVLSYLTAYQYFFGQGPADGIFPKLIPYNILWLQFTGKLSIHMGILLDPISVMMLVVITTVSFMVHIYSIGYMKGETGFVTVFCLSVPVYLFDAGTGGGHQYFPDVYFLGTGGCFILPADRLLLRESLGSGGLQKGIYCHPFCRPGISDRHSDSFLLYRHI